METTFGFSYYETEFLREKIYYRPGDPKVYDGRDYRSADQKAADQIAGVEAEAKWRASQSQIAAFEQQRAQQERDEQKPRQRLAKALPLKNRIRERAEVLICH